MGRRGSECRVGRRGSECRVMRRGSECRVMRRGSECRVGRRGSERRGMGRVIVFKCKAIKYAETGIVAMRKTEVRPRAKSFSMDKKC